MEHSLTEKFEQAFTIMSRAKDVGYKKLGVFGLEYKFSEKIAGDIIHYFKLIKGYGYGDVNGIMVPCKYPALSLDITTECPRRPPTAATVTTILCLPASSEEVSFNEMIRGAVSSQTAAKDFLKENKHKIGRLHADIADMGIRRSSDNTFSLEGKDYTLILDNTPIIGSAERNPTLTLLGKFDDPPNCIKACANAFEDIETLGKSLSVQTAMLNNYLESNI